MPDTDTNLLIGFSVLALSGMVISFLGLLAYSKLHGRIEKLEASISKRDSMTPHKLDERS